MTMPADLPVLSFGPFVLDRANARLTRDGQALDLPPKDLDVLAFLAQRPARLVSKDELLDAVWQHRFVSDSVLASVVSRLRGVLGDSAREPRYIETAPRRGYRFIAAVRHAAAPPVPALPPVPGAVAGPGTLIGRGAAMAALQRELQAVVAGKTRVVLLAGEAGIGKSSLIESFTQALAEGGGAVAVAHGQCVEHTGSVEPYLPVLEALNGLCRSLPQAGLPALMRQVAPAWLVQMPWWVAAEDRAALQQEVAGSGQDRMLREFGELLERLSHAQPLLLVLEDLHWSDAASVQLIGYLARRRGAARVLLLGSLRPAEVIVSDHPLKALRHELRQQRLCDEIDLELFSETDAAAYLLQRLPARAWPDTLVRELHRHTGGLPLFMAAVLDELQGQMHAQADAGVLPLQQVPRSILGLIEQQHARVAEPTRQWLTAASVCGVEFTHTLLADALRVDAGMLQAAFDTLVRGRSWLRSVGVEAQPDGRVAVRYAFVHAVHRNVLYELAGAASRVTAHRQLAAALLQLHADDKESVAAEAAMHFEMGQDPGHAVQYLALAARQALRRFAAADAAAIAERALALLSALPGREALRDTELALHVTLGVAQAQRMGVMSSESRSAFGRTRDLMADLRDAPARVPAMHGIWWATLACGDMRRARAMAEQSLALAAARDDPMLRFAGHSALGITLVHVGELPAAQQHLLQALQAHGDGADALPPAMFSFDPGVQLASYLALCLWMQRQPGEAGLRLQQALGRAESLRHPLTLVLALHFQATLESLAEDFEHAHATTERALHLIEEHRLHRVAGPYRWLQGRAQAERGAVDEGLAAMREGRDLQEQSGLRYGLTRWHCSYAEVNLKLGRRAAAEAAIADGLALAEHGGETAAVPELQLLQGQVQRVRGDGERAAQSIECAVALARQQGAGAAEWRAMQVWGQLKGETAACLGLSLQQLRQRP